MTQKQYRQGDVLLIEIESLNTDGFTERENRTVALGEATGHHHTFDECAVVYEEQKDSTLAVNERGMLVEVTGEYSVLSHQEHAPIAIPKGKYRRVIQREYFPDAIRNVAD